jgi:hypothetical protein
MAEPTLAPPSGGAKITIADGKLTVPNLSRKHISDPTRH